MADVDGEWTFIDNGDGSGEITHQRADNTRYSWAYDKGTQGGDDAAVGTLGGRQSLGGGGSRRRLGVEEEITQIQRGIHATVAVPRYLDTIANAEKAAEDFVISQIRAGLRTYAKNKLYENGRETWPSNPFDALAEKPAGHTDDGDMADTDGEWTFDLQNIRITHQRADNTRYSWTYDKGMNDGSDNDAVGTLGARVLIGGGSRRRLGVEEEITQIQRERASDVAVPRYLDTIANAEASAEDFVISQIRAGLRTYARNKLYENGREIWPSNPFDALAEKPAGHTTDIDTADTDGEWTFDLPNSRITHQRADNSRYQWMFDVGDTGDDTSHPGFLGARTVLVTARRRLGVEEELTQIQRGYVSDVPVPIYMEAIENAEKAVEDAVIIMIKILAINDILKNAPNTMNPPSVNYPYGISYGYALMPIPNYKDNQELPQQDNEWTFWSLSDNEHRDSMHRVAHRRRDNSIHWWCFSSKYTGTANPLLISDRDPSGGMDCNHLTGTSNNLNTELVEAYSRLAIYASTL